MRVIDAESLFRFLNDQRVKETGAFSKGLNKGINIARGAVRNEEICPTVDAVLLPCKIGDDVYIIPSKVNFCLNVLNRHEENNRIYHQKVDSITFTGQGWYVRGDADHEYGTGSLLLDRFYKETWFLTREEAEAALAKMKGGDEDGPAQT